MVHLGAERLHVSARMRLDCTEASPDTAPAPPIVWHFPHFSYKLKARNKGGGYCGCVCACVCIRVCVCIARGRRLREEEEGGGVVGNRSILQMLRGRRSEWKVLWLSVARRSLTRGGMPHATFIQTQIHFLSDGAIAEKVWGKRVTER